MAPNTIILSPRNHSKAEALAKQYPDQVLMVAENNQQVIDASDWVFVATPPNEINAKAVFSTLKFRPNQVVVCLIAALSAAKLRQFCQGTTAIVQAVPLPPAADFQSTTIVTPKSPEVEAVLRRLGRVFAVDSSRAAMCLASISCTMGNFYKTLQTQYEWLAAEHVSPSTATACIASYYTTFCHATSKAATSRGDGFQHLVDEQTPGGVNEMVIRKFNGAGQYSMLSYTMDDILKVFL